MPTPNIEPYLFFGGRCEEAIEFYRTALGAEIGDLMRMKDSPDPCPEMPPGWAEKVMHTSFRVGGSTIMASDGMSAEKTQFEGFSLSISLTDEATAKRFFDALAAGGEVRMPLGKTFWSPCFGMVADKFGVGWMINVLP